MSLKIKDLVFHGCLADTRGLGNRVCNFDYLLSRLLYNCQQKTDSDTSYSCPLKCEFSSRNIIDSCVKEKYISKTVYLPSIASLSSHSNMFECVCISSFYINISLYIYLFLRFPFTSALTSYRHSLISELNKIFHI